MRAVRAGLGMYIVGAYKGKSTSGKQKLTTAKLQPHNPLGYKNDLIKIMIRGIERAVYALAKLILIRCITKNQLPVIEF